MKRKRRVWWRTAVSLAVAGVIPTAASGAAARRCASLEAVDPWQPKSAEATKAPAQPLQDTFACRNGVSAEDSSSSRQQVSRRRLSSTIRLNHSGCGR